MNQGKSITGARIHRSNRVPTRTRTRETSLVRESVGMIAQHHVTWAPAPSTTSGYRRLCTSAGVARRAGLEVGDIQMKGANLFHVRGGVVTRLVLYWDRERAFADFGLGE